MIERSLVIRLSLFSLIVVLLQTASSGLEDNVIAKDGIQFTKNDFTLNEIEKQFNAEQGTADFALKSENNNKVSVIIMQKPQKNGNARKTFDFRAEGLQIGANSFSKQDIAVKNRFSTINGFSAEITKETYEKLRADESIIIQYDHPMRAFLQDSTKLVNATRTWSAVSAGLNITGKGQTICILDTGLNYSHADFGACSASNFTNENCAKAPSGWDYANNDNNPYDDNGHGTHVAGIAAASGGIRGVAPDAKVIPIKVLNSAGTGSEANIISGVEWCTNNATKYNISVISMSLGSSTTYSGYCDGNFSAFAAAVNSAIAKNITVVAATGNDGSSTQIASPACIKNATSVGATTKADGIATDYSNRNSITDLLAPGGIDNTQTIGINSTSYVGGYVGKYGTSMATPHAAGAAALLQQFAKLELNRNFTANETQTYLYDYGKTVSESGINYKRIDIIQTLISLDKKAPSLVLNTPANGSLIVLSQLVTFNISDNILLDKIWYNTNNGANTTSGSSISTAGWSASNITLNIFANDSAGNMNWSAYYFQISNPAPAVSNIAITPATAYTNDTLRCNYTYSDANSDAENGTLIQWFASGIENTTLQNLTTANASFTEKNQVWFCAVTPNDGVNLGVRANSTNITIQNFPLIVNYTTLTAGKVNGGIIINATMFDIDVDDVDVVNFYYQNATQTTFIVNDTNSPYSISWNTSTAGDGNYTILINATDGSANANRTVADIFVNNINIAPNITITSPNGSESWSGTNTITWSASDPDYDMMNFTIYYGMSGGAGWTLLGTATETSFSWNTATASNGAGYRINVTATDGVYNVSDISDSNFTISNTASNPTTTGSSGGGGGGMGAGSSDPNKNSFLFPEIAKDSSQSISISAKIAATDIEFTVTEAVQNAKVVVKKTDGPAIPAKEAFAYFEVDTTNLDNKIKGAKITFRVDPKWLKDNNIDKKTVSLYRYFGGWQKLDTYLVRADDIDAIYYANSPGFSTFVIAGEKSSTPIPAEEKKEEKKETTEISGFSATNAKPAGGFNFKYVVFVIAMVVAVLLAIAKVPALFRKPKSSKPRDLKAEYAEYQKRVQEFYRKRVNTIRDARRKQIEARQANQVQRARPFVSSPQFSKPAEINQGAKNQKPKTNKTSVIKWLFTDTKVAKQQEKKEKSKNKERPDFGF